MKRHTGKEFMKIYNEAKGIKPEETTVESDAKTETDTETKE